jgi:outer membrane protein assembly factor BamD (BamD/ComL family)
MKPKRALLAALVRSLMMMSFHQQANCATTSDSDETAPSPQASAQVEALLLEGQTNYTHGRYREAIHAFEQAKEFGTSSSYQKALLALGLAEAR